MRAAIQKCKNKRVLPLQPPKERSLQHAGNGVLTGITTTPRSIPPGLLSATGGDSVKKLEVESHFLSKYDDSGKKRENPELSGEPSTATPKFSHKRQVDQTIDLTGVSDDEPSTPAPAYREGKRRKLDRHGRERRSKPSRAASQVYEDGLNGKKQPPRSIPRGNGQRKPRSSTSRKSEKLWRRSDRERDARDSPDGKLQHRPRPMPRPDPRVEPSPSQFQRQNQGNPQRPVHSQPSSHGEGKSTTDGDANAITHRPTAAGDKARSRLEQLKARQAATKNPPIAGLLCPDSDAGLYPENDADLFRHFSSKAPEKRVTQLMPSGPNFRQHLEPNGYREASQRAKPRSLPHQENDTPNDHYRSTTARQLNNEIPHLSPPQAPAANRQTSQLSQSHNIFNPPKRAAQPRTSLPSPQPRSYIPPPQATQAPPPAFASIRHTQPQTQAQTQIQPKTQPSKQPPRETASALDVLGGPERSILQYFPYRTDRFTSAIINVPDFTDRAAMLHHRQQRERVPISKTKWFSAEDANASAARAMDKVVYSKGKDEDEDEDEDEDGDGGEDVDRGEGKTKGKTKGKGNSKDKDKGVTGWKKDVVGQEVGREYSGLGGLGLEGAGAELFEGRVRFKNGEVQYFWVDVEVVRLGVAVEKAKGGLRVDREGAEVYRQRRFDVWARVWCSEEGREGQRGQGGQRIVFDCGVEGEGEESHGGKGAAGESGGNGDGVAENGDGSGHGRGDENREAGEAEVELGPEHAEDRDGQDNDDDGNDKNGDNSTSSAPSVSSTATLPVPALSTSLRDRLEITHHHRGSYTTLQHANRAAFSAFLELAKPKNCSIEDNHHYIHSVEPEYTELFEETDAVERDCTATVHLEWEPPVGPRHRWGFVKLEVEVVHSELQGPIDIGNLVVRGGGRGAQKGGDGGNGVVRQNNGGAGEVMGDRREVRVRKPVGALPSPLEELEEEPKPASESETEEISEESEEE